MKMINVSGGLSYLTDQKKVYMVLSPVVIKPRTCSNCARKQRHSSLDLGLDVMPKEGRLLNLKHSHVHAIKRHDLKL